MSSRTLAQLALVLIGLIVWGYGARINDDRLTLIGVGCFAAAVVLRLMKNRWSRRDDGPSDPHKPD